jgi:hypothetical protein
VIGRVHSDNWESVLRFLGLNYSIIIGIVVDVLFYMLGRALGQEMIVSIKIFFLVLFLKGGDLPLKIILIVVILRLTGVKVIV